MDDFYKIVKNDKEALTTLKKLISQASDLTFKKDREKMEIEVENQKKRTVEDKNK